MEHDLRVRADDALGVVEERLDCGWMGWGGLGALAGFFEQWLLLRLTRREQPLVGRRLPTAWSSLIARGLRLTRGGFHARQDGLALAFESGAIGK